MRAWRILVVLVAIGVALGRGAGRPEAARAYGTPAPAASPPAAVAGGRLVTLADGRALLLGAGAAARYDPATDAWTLTAPPLAARDNPPLIALRDGRALAVGNLAATSTALAEVYDPATDRWTPTGPMRAARYGHSATPLADGRVLVAGGLDDTGTPLLAAEIYDPATDRWATVAALGQARHYHSAALLGDGRVLVAGGHARTADGPDANLQTAEVYDPAADRWRAVAPLPYRAYGPFGINEVLPLVALADGGALLVTNGEVTESGGVVYEPAADRWRTTGPFVSRTAPADAVRLASGRVLVVSHQTTALYEPATGQLGLAAHYDLADPALSRRATVLGDGRILLVAGSAALLVREEGWPADFCLDSVGTCVQGIFLRYWQEHGGLAINGLPLTPERREVLEDGREYTVQYFERVRLEYHPENPPPHQVLLGQFGRYLYPADPPVPPPTGPLPGGHYFPETGHIVEAGFFAFWQARGGLAQFGYPLSEVVTETLEDGNRYRVQYFERARFEEHPEVADPQYRILLGQFGRAIEQQNRWLEGYPGFARLYRTSAQLRGQLGLATSGPDVGAGATQAFEGGRLIFHPRGLIFALRGAATSGALVLPSVAQGYEADGAFAYRDYWYPDRRPGGPGPAPGLYEPGQGFGAVWRGDATVRAALGYATTPGEAGGTVAVQYFARGLLLGTETPEERFIYAVLFTRDAAGRVTGATYERFDNPAP